MLYILNLISLFEISSYAVLVTVTDGRGDRDFHATARRARYPQRQRRGTAVGTAGRRCGRPPSRLHPAVGVFAEKAKSAAGGLSADTVPLRCPAVRGVRGSYEESFWTSTWIRSG